MACLTKKRKRFHIRFRLQQRSYCRTLKTTNDSDAEAALHLVEHTLYRLRVGLLQLPPGVDLGDFVVSGGTLQAATVQRKATTRELISRYLAAEAERISDTFLSTKKIHLKHLLSFLDKRADQPALAVNEDALRCYQQTRSKNVEKTTVNKEIVTLKHLYAWGGRGKLSGTIASGALAPLQMPHGSGPVSHHGGNRSDHCSGWLDRRRAAAAVGLPLFDAAGNCRHPGDRAR